ncbi:ArsR/SmtB family transcription factor [Halobaculum halobium]|uniref:ArsR/SmtB family transcription factor n=1 Tax=Halobaculum halobium TaxID=3032281 RepID=A0ABD5T9T1_9EURY|nr:winged helix-turn-helix domain-containing protein [Halobaculum sp. SYNS20]
MSGTLPSSADDPDDDEGSDGTDRAPEETSGARTDGGAAESDAVRTRRPPASDGVESSASVDADSQLGDVEPSSPDGAADADTGDNEGVRICWIDDDGADDLIGALAPETARTILGAVHEEPQTASELADAADTSVQNVRHHVSKLVDTGLVEATDTRYSVKGREMTVYGPADDRVVVAVGGESERSSLLDSLRGLGGAVAVLAGASLLVQSLFGAEVATLSGPETAPRIGDAVGGTGGAILGTVSPGVAFLVGGLLVLATLVAADRVRTR